MMTIKASAPAARPRTRVRVSYRLTFSTLQRTCVHPRRVTTLSQCDNLVTTIPIAHHREQTPVMKSKAAAVVSVRKESVGGGRREPTSKPSDGKFAGTEAARPQNPANPQHGQAARSRRSQQLTCPRRHRPTTQHSTIIRSQGFGATPGCPRPVDGIEDGLSTRFWVFRLSSR